MRKLYRTPTYNRALYRIFRYSLEHFGRRVAEETLRQIRDVEQALEQGENPGKIEPHYHSKHLYYVNTRNSQSVFYEIVGDAVYLVTAGYNRWPWKDILGEIEPQTEPHRVAGQSCSQEED